MHKTFYIFFFFFLGFCNANAQQTPQIVQFDTTRITVSPISEAELNEFKKDPKLNYEIKDTAPTWWDNFTSWVKNLFLRFFEWVFGVDEAIGALAIFLRILPYILLAILLYVLIRFFMNVHLNAKTNDISKNTVVAMSEEEHLIKNENLQQLLQKALNDKNYRLAVRYYYLYILQLMSNKELIDWQLQKTNHDYENEITKPNLKKAFTKITRLYDYVWYGDFDIDEPQYQKAEIIFSEVKTTVEE